MPIIIGVVFVLIAVFVVLCVVTVRSPKFKGKRGENLVAVTLGNTVPGEQYVINDLLFEIEPEQSCQIDHIVINRAGIWVIETKNYSGRIYGRSTDNQWTQVLAGGHQKNKFYNPFKQNSKHIYRLSKYLNVNDIFFNVVVFLSGADISRVDCDNVCSVRRLPSIIRKTTNVSLTTEKMEYYYRKLMELKNNSAISDTEHVENINKKKVMIQNGICPCCGGKLVLRNGKNGQFYGCSNYPSCKFTKNIK